MNTEHELRRRIAELDRRVDALERHLGVSPPPEPSPDELSPEVHQLVQQGKLMDAIKQHRAETGLGLAEAKDVVERYRP